MNYNEVFANLKTNNKYSRKSPHKAILLLSIINLYEKGVLTENDIRYTDSLINEFRNVWNILLVDEQCFHPEMFYPFWFMQSEDFWHVVLNTGYETEYKSMIEERIKPTEAKVKAFINHVELDYDLYFLLTLASGRASLRQSLLDTFPNLDQSIANRILKMTNNISKPENQFATELETSPRLENHMDAISVEQEKDFLSLDEDLQYAIQIAYYSYLKQHHSTREIIKDLVPSAGVLYHHLINKNSDLRDETIYIREIYSNFLCELRASLMSEDNAMEVVDLINSAIQQIEEGNVQNSVREEVLNTFDDYKKELDKQFEAATKLVREETTQFKVTINEPVSTEANQKEDRRGKQWTDAEKELCQKLFQSGYTFQDIAAELGRTEVAVKMRLGAMGLIDYTYEGPDAEAFKTLQSSAKDVQLPTNIHIVNENGYGKILNAREDTLFSEKGFLKELNGNIYRFNLKYECFTVKEIGYQDKRWLKSGKLLVAPRNSALYQAVINSYGYISHIKAFASCPDIRRNEIKYDNQWYDFNGDIVL